ncbi:MAG: DUF3078 domain-containing protein [Calditrichaeota bacterium]|nr:DUF3078 domain-containing protein [Calditrichota bacterium]RQV99720.1 MAG: DUF3078 domain-containing protein [Calditrichota bacterium]
MYRNELLYVLCGLLMFVFSAVSQDAEKEKEKPKLGWHNEVIGGLNLTQAAFDNWAQGGENNIAWQLNLNAKSVLEQQKYSWTNTGKLAFGKSKIGDQESRKSVDEIRLETVYTYKLNLYVNPYASAYGETQLAKGYKYTDTTQIAISNFFDPAYFVQSIGLGYSHKEIIKTRLGAALKETLADNYALIYSDDPETTADIEKSRVELGAESVTDLSVKLAQNMLFTSRLELFSAFDAFNQTDVRWDNIIAAKVAKYVEVNFNLRLLYDRDISIQRQLKQALAVGLTYTFL